MYVPSQWGGGRLGSSGPAGLGDTPDTPDPGAILSGTIAQAKANLGLAFLFGVAFLSGVFYIAFRKK